ncbi:SoxR reducing system RseC family protein [bacterium]|nr:SoxR reducing system RseC family protein [bacterium]
MKETGVVDAVEKGEVLVRLKRHSACLGCKACSIGTGGDMIIKAIATDKVYPPSKNFGGGVKVGDQVTIEIASISILKAIVMVYLFPTAAFLAGILAGLKIAPQLGIYEHKEILSILTGAALLCASLLLARRYGIRRRETYKARITGIRGGG